MASPERFSVSIHATLMVEFLLQINWKSFKPNWSKYHYQTLTKLGSISSCSLATLLSNSHAHHRGEDDTKQMYAYMGCSNSRVFLKFINVCSYKQTRVSFAALSSMYSSASAWCVDTESLWHREATVSFTNQRSSCMGTVCTKGQTTEYAVIQRRPPSQSVREKHLFGTTWLSVQF